MNTGAALLRSARARAGLTQARLGARLGVSQAAIARLEDPATNPTLATLDDALRATGHRLTLTAEPFEPKVDEGQLARHVAMTPAQRLASLTAAHRNVRQLVAGVGKRP